MIREHTKRRRTADGNADGVTVLVRNGDVHVGREVAPAELGREVGVHVERVLVDVQFVAASGSATAEQEQTATTQGLMAKGCERGGRWVDDGTVGEGDENNAKGQVHDRVYS